MSKSRAGDPLAHLTRVNSSVYLLERSQGNISRDDDVPTPDTVLLFAWLGASPRYIAKYIACYTELYPSARLVLVTTSLADLTYRTYAAQTRRLKPVIDVVHAASSNGGGRGRVLVHAFSNGGAHTTCVFFRGFREATMPVGGNAAAPVRALILDSAPGRATFRRLAKAMWASLPKQLYIRLPILLLTYIFVGLLWTINHLLGREDLISEMRHDLNDPGIVARDMPRCYIFSETDPMVGCDDVQEHVLKAERAGWPVLKEKYKDSAHVGHVRANEERYWDAVKRTWLLGMRESSGELPN